MVERHASSSRSDDDLAAAIQRDPDGPGGQAALAELLERWNENVYRWTYRFTGEREQALDLAQDAMLQAIRGLRSYRSRGRFSAWLFTIVHNRCIDAARRRRAAPLATEDMDAFEAPGDAAWWAERRLDHERVLSAMREHLADDERVALWLRVHEGSSVEEITRLLRLENATGARAVLQSARRKLRAVLADLASSPEEGTP